MSFLKVKVAILSTASHGILPVKTRNAKRQIVGRRRIKRRGKKGGGRITASVETAHTPPKRGLEAGWCVVVDVVTDLAV